MIIFASVALVVPASSRAMKEQVSEPLARQIGENWLSRIVQSRGQWGGSDSPAIGRTEVIGGERGALAYVLGVEPGGFVVVPTDRSLPPILAYSDGSMYRVDAEGGFPAMIREKLLQREKMRTENPRGGESPPQESDLARAWRVLSLDQAKFRIEVDRDGTRDVEVGPLMTTRWHQDAPYNLRAPNGDGGRCVVGCVATAVAQIMNYHEWPPAGIGSYSYNWNGDDSCDGVPVPQLLEVDLSDAYDWAGMQDEYPQDFDPSSVEAVKDLCYEVGVAMRMDFGHCESTAYYDQAIEALTQRFRYDDSIEYQLRVDHTSTSWFEYIRAEIDAGRPMLYSIDTGPDPDDGHAIVCDGYRVILDIAQISVNYGWGDQNPAQIWYAIDGLYDSYNPLEEIIVGRIMPNRVYISGDVQLSDGTGVPGVSLGGGDHSAVTDGSGSYTLAVLDGWTGMVVPERPDFVFSPSSRLYPDPLFHDRVDEDYVANGLPDLMSSSTSPDPCFEGDTVTFTVDFMDQDGRAPATAELWFNGEPIAMSSEAEEFNTFQAFTCSVTVNVGNVPYSYRFVDSDGVSAQLPATGAYILEVLPLEPDITITRPTVDEDPVDTQFQIEWVAVNASSVDLYYDTDFDPAEIILIAAGVPNSGAYVWDVTGIPDGNYTIYGHVESQGDVDSDYGSGYVIVNHNLMTPREFGDPLLVTDNGNDPYIVASTNEPGKFYISMRRSDGMYFTSSSDLGQAWSAPLQLTSDVVWGHEIALDQSTGTLHFAWEAEPYGYHMRSTDGGLNWSAPGQFGDRVEDRVHIAALDGHVTLAWLSWTPGHGIIKSRCSSSDGVSWQGDTVVYDPGDDASRRMDIVNHGSSRSSIAYTANFSPQDRYVHFKPSSDWGCSWQGERNLPDPDNGDATRISIGARGDRVFVVWTDDLVYSAYSDDAGVTWSTPSLVPIPSSSIHQFTVTEALVGVTYKIGDVVGYVESEDDGLTWTDVAILTNNSADTLPSIASWGNDVVVAYREMDVGIVIRTATDWEPSIDFEVVSPNGGEDLSPGAVETISWIAPPESEIIRILFSIDAGQNWTTIVTATPNDGSHEWIVPESYSDDCLVRVQDASNELARDDSDAPFAIVMPGDPIAVYRLDGDTLDASGRGHHGVAYGVTWEDGVSAITGLSGRFTAAESDYVSVPDDPDFLVGEGAWAVSMWIYHDSVATGMKYLQKQRGQPDSGSYAGMMCQMELLDDVPRFAIRSGDIGGWSLAYSATIVEADRWYHVVFQRTSQQLEIWVDGVLDATGSEAGWDIDIDNDNPLILGANRDHLAGFFDGWLDEIAIFGHELTAEQIAGFYQEPLQGSLLMASPNGGEQLAYGSETIVEWLSPGLGAVDLLYSIDDGASWSTIAENLPDSGSFTWLVPDTPSPHCRMRVRDSSDHAHHDDSNGPFTILFMPDMVAEWELDGSADDSSFQGHDGVVYGVDWVAGVDEAEASAAQFVASEGDYVAVSHHPDFNVGTGPWAISLWLKHASLDTPMKYVQKQRGSPGSGSYAGMMCSLSLEDGMPRFAIQSGDIRNYPEESYSWAYSTTVVELDRWYHVVFQRTNQQLEIWVDGVLDGGGSDPDWDIDIDNDNPLIIGANRDAMAGFFDGSMDQVRVFRRHLGAEEVSLLADEFLVVSVADDGELPLAPAVTRLEQCRPNPFNPATTIRYRLAEPSMVSIKVFDLNGRLVTTLVSKTMVLTGDHDVTWRGLDSEARPVAAGVYLCRLVAGDYAETRRMVLIR